MSSHTATGRSAAEPDANEQAVVSQSAPPGDAPPGQQHLQKEHISEEVTQELQEVAEELTDGAGEMQPEEVVKVAIGASAVLLGTAVLIGGALFAAGFLRRPIERAASRLILRIQDIQVSSGLPLVIMDIFREMRADMNVVSAMSDDLRAAR